MNIDERCAAVYAETRELPLLKANPALGFEILMGPPRHRPQVAFIGYQPGDGAMTIQQARQAGYEQRWPSENEYLTQPYLLARRLRGMFGNELLKQCVGLNAIFLRAQSISIYNSLVSRRDRRVAQAFCLDQVRVLLDVMEPRSVVAIGFSTLSLFGGGQADLHGEAGRVLTKTGEVFGRPALATLHLSGARIARGDLARIAERVRDLASA